MGLFVRIVNDLIADYEFLWAVNISLVNKIQFIVNKYFSILLNKRNVSYLGYNFVYDTRISPLILQFYPRELNTLNKYIQFSKINSVLDIGANIGQWAFTAIAFYPHLKIYSFEPNKAVFLNLKSNSSYFKNWRIYNYAISKKNKDRDLFFVRDSTIGGSFFENIAKEFQPGEVTKRVKVHSIKLDLNSTKKLNMPTKFDLVKIDVEGAELEVLESLNRIEFKYLIIEVPIKSKRDVSIDKISTIITEKFHKKPKLLFIKPIGNMGVVSDAVYELVK